MKTEKISPEYFTSELILDTNRVENIISKIFDDLKTATIWECKTRKVKSVSIPIGFPWMSFDESYAVKKAIKQAGWKKFEISECFDRRDGWKVDKQVYLNIRFYFPLSIMDRFRRLFIRK